MSDYKNVNFLVGDKKFNFEALNPYDDIIIEFLSEFSEGQFLGEKRMVLIYNYEPALQTGFSTTKSTTFELKGNSPSSFEFNISKVKFDGENRVFAWHPKSGFIRID